MLTIRETGVSCDKSIDSRFDSKQITIPFKISADEWIKPTYRKG